MLAAERIPLMSAVLPDAVATNADIDSPVEEAVRERWQRVIDYTLIEWGSDASRFDDEGVEPPSRQIVQLAINLATSFRDKGVPAPDCVVPDPNGGIVFERRENGLSEVYHVWDDGTVEYQRFQGTRLVERSTL